MRIISLVNNKGGQGKTTTAVNLSAFLSLHDKKVLLIDMDSQRSASLSLGFEEVEGSTIAHALLEGEPIEKAIIKTEIENLDLIPGDMALANFDISIADMEGREKKLQESLSPVKKKYDYIFIDSPPSLSLLTINSLVASDYVLIPITPQYLSMEGLKQLLGVINRIRDTMKARLEVLGIVFCMVDFRMRITEEVIRAIRDHFKDKVFKSVIRQNVKLIEAPSHSKAIFDYAPGSTGAEGYKNLSKELIRRLQK